MAETRTLQLANNPRVEGNRASLFEGNSAPGNTEQIGWRNQIPLIHWPSLENQIVVYLPPSHDDFGSVRVIDVLLLPMSRVSTSSGPVNTIRHHLPKLQDSTESSLVVASNSNPAWYHSPDLSLQGNRAPSKFALYTSKAGDELSNMLIDDLISFAKKRTASVHDLAERQKTVIVGRGQERLATKLRMSFEDSPFEDGMDHPAERIIAEALLSTNDHPVLDWLRAYCTDASQPSFAASVLRCLGRHRSVGTVSWRVELVHAGLTIDNVEIRDAAVQAAESWGASDFLPVLRGHCEPEPWLRQYIFDVVDDLAG